MSTIDRKDFDEGFNSGILWVLARLIDVHDQPTMAAELAKESNVDFRYVDEADKVSIEKLKEEISGNPITH